MPLLKTEATAQIFEAAKRAGLSPEQADDLSTLHLGKFQIVNDRVMFGTVEITNTDAFRAAIEKATELAHLTPRQVDPQVAIAAFVHRSPAARVQVMANLSEPERDRLAQQFGLKSFSDYRRGVAPADFGTGKSNGGNEKSTNPWATGSWSVDRQIDFARRFGHAKAAELARAAGSFVGATRPGARNLTSIK